jgi:LPPG:FO 2-phospho-L-lactate transferase
VIAVTEQRILAFSGGVGGAKLALGLSLCLQPHQLTVVANTGDDFEHLGLTICPDLDTVMYTLAGRSNSALGWGQEGESWACLEALEELGAETWFKLGDRDLATHLSRSQLLRDGLTLTAATDALCRKLDVGPRILPMSDAPVRTMVYSDQGTLPFQHYFVRLRCEPSVSGFRFDGLEAAAPQAEFMAALHDPQLSAIVICPSNPFVSVDPILALEGVRHALNNSAAPVIAVSPIVAGMAIKGPAAKMMAELGMPVTAEAVAEHYRGLVDHFVLDQSDVKLVASIEAMGMRVSVTNTVMKSRADREALGRFVLQQATMA